MNCRKCGTEIQPGDYICRNCLTVVDETQPSNMERQQINNVPVRKRSSCLAVILSFLLAIVFLAVSVGTTVVYVARDLISTKTIKTVIRNVNISEITISGDNGQKMDLSAYITDKANEKLGSDQQITEDTVKELIDDQEVKDYFADIVGDFDAFLAGEKDIYIDPDDTVDIVQKKYEEINGSEMPEEMMVAVKENFEQVSEVINEGLAEIKIEMKENVSFDTVDSVYSLGKVFERQVFITLLSILAVNILLILLVNFRNIKAGFMTLLIPSMIMMGIMYLANKYAYGMVKDLVNRGDFSFLNLEDIIVGGVHSAFIIWGIASAVFLGGYILLSAIENIRIKNADF